MSQNTPLRRGVFGLAAAAAAVLLLAGCASAPAVGGDPVGSWGSSEERKPQLVLEKDGSLNGTDGCNRLLGTWKDDGGKVDFGDGLASTMMFCEGVDTWLSKAVRAEVRADELVVFGEKDTEIGTLPRIES